MKKEEEPALGSANHNATAVVCNGAGSKAVKNMVDMRKMPYTDACRLDVVLEGAEGGDGIWICACA